MKIVALLAFAFFGFCVAQYNAPVSGAVLPSHHASWGFRSSYDKILARETVQQSFGFLRVVSQDYEYPCKDHFNYYDITAVRVTDNYKDGNGGYATLVSGGPGQRYVKIHLKSQRNHGYNFTIEIYGRSTSF